MSPQKIDFKKTFKNLYQASTENVSIIDVPKLQFLMIDGIGAPDTSKQFQEALNILYPVAYRLKFISKSMGKDYVVPPLEGLWWADNMSDFINGKRDKWKWTLMIMQPEWINDEIFNKAINIVREKKPELKNNIDKLRFADFKEGKCAQILHIGPYSEEKRTIEKLHEYIKKIDGKFDGKIQKHHEIYLNDPRRTKLEKLKTILRQPFIINKR